MYILVYFYSEMEIRFFPGPKARQTLSDTFSLQEFHGSIESEDLDLIPPQHATKTDNQCCSLVLQRCTILWDLLLILIT